MKKVINSFRGEYEFLSNFYICDVPYKGLIFRSSEAAFQSQKSLDPNAWKLFTNFDPQKSKMFGRRAPMTPTEIKNWKEGRAISVMEDVVYAKFIHNQVLMTKLLATGTAELIEGNTWDDTYWGVCNGVGENHLGKILMEVRDYGLNGQFGFGAT